MSKTALPNATKSSEIQEHGTVDHAQDVNSQSPEASGKIAQTVPANNPKETLHIEEIRILKDHNQVEDIEMLKSDVKQLQQEVRQLHDKMQPTQRETEESDTNKKSQLYHAISAFFEWLSQKAPVIAASEAENKHGIDVLRHSGSSEGEENFQENGRGLMYEHTSTETVNTNVAGVLVEERPKSDESKLQERITHLASENRDLVSDLNRLSSEIDRLSAQNRSLEPENEILTAEISLLSNKYQDLQDQYNSHRCPNDDELEVLDAEIIRTFDDLQKTIAYLFDGCDVEHLTLDAAQDMSKSCRVSMDPIWWEFLEEDARKLWLASLLANVLHRQFFKYAFFGLEDKVLEYQLVAFEEMLLEESSGVSERHILEWRARTFRMAEILNRKSGHSSSTQLDRVVMKLDDIFGKAFENSKESLQTLQQVCRKALHCAFLLRKTKTKYTWEQRNLPADLSRQAVVIKRILKPETIEGAETVDFEVFNVFGEVVKWYREVDPVTANMLERCLVLSRAVVAMP